MKNLYTLKPQIRFSLIVFLLATFNLFAQTTYNITDPEALENHTFVPGDIII